MSMSLPEPAITALCQRYGVAQLYVFGSAVTPRFSLKDSDVDMLVALLPAPPLAQGEALLSLWEALEALLGRRVDLLTPDSLRNPVLKAEIERTKELVYDASCSQVSG